LLMPGAVLLLGDVAVPDSGSFASLFAGAAASETWTTNAARPEDLIGVVAFANLETCRTRRALRMRLAHMLEAAVGEAENGSATTHVILVASVRPEHARRFHRTASSCASRGRAELERHGRTIEITLIDATSCDDPESLATRVRRRVHERAGIAGTLVVSWNDIRSCDIADVARQRYL
jgi:hypothetical protein